MRKIFKKVKISITIGLIAICFLIYPMVWESIAHNLLTQNVKTQSMGNMKTVIADLELNPTAHVYHTGLQYVFYFGITPRGTAAATTNVVTVLNSNDGTFNSSPGDIYITYESTSWATGSTLTIGK